MGKIDIKTANEILARTRHFMRGMWSSHMNVYYLITFVIVLYQYIEAWTAIKLSLEPDNEYVRDYYIQSEKIASKMDTNWVKYAMLVKMTREGLCHKFGSLACVDNLKTVARSMTKMQEFLIYLGIFDREELTDGQSSEAVHVH